MPNAYFYSSTAGTYTLTGSINSSVTSISVSSVTGLPSSAPFKVVIDPGQGTEEIVKVTAVAGTTLTVVRGHDGSTAASHAAGATVRHMLTAEDLTLSRTHEAASAAVHGVTGSVVGTTDVQTMTNKNLTSGTNTFPTSLATLTGAQVLTNKDLTSGSNTFPSSLLTLTSNQTPSNKIFDGALNTFQNIAQAAISGLPAALTSINSTLATKQNIPSDSGWQNVTIAGGFAALASPEQPQVRKIGNIVYMRGGWDNTGMAAGGTFNVGTLPAGFIMSINSSCPVASSSGAATAHCHIIGVTGQITLRLGSTLGAYYKWDRQSYPID